MATPAYALPDETVGLHLVTPGNDQREGTRYLWTPLDVIDPERKYQLSDDGVDRAGEEVSSRCFRRSWCQNFVPRATFTPLEQWFEPIGLAELIPEGVRPVTLNVPLPPIPAGMPPTQFVMAHRPPVGIPSYPGDDMPLILAVAGYRGLGEIKALRGEDWDAGEARRLQEEFFPASWPKPIALRLLEERIAEVGKHGQDAAANEMLGLCEKGRRWARHRIDTEHTLLQTRVKHEHTYTYSVLAPQLLAQLEMSPRDGGSETMQLAEAIVKAMLDRQAQPQTVDVEAIVKAVLMAQAAVQAAAPEATPEPESRVNEFKCSWCEEKFNTEQGKALHENRWCKNKPE